MRMIRAVELATLGLAIALVFLGHGAQAELCEVHPYTGPPVAFGSTAPGIGATIELGEPGYITDVTSGATVGASLAMQKVT